MKSRVVLLWAFLMIFSVQSISAEPSAFKPEYVFIPVAVAIGVVQTYYQFKFYKKLWDDYKKKNESKSSQSVTPQKAKPAVKPEPVKSQAENDEDEDEDETDDEGEEDEDEDES